MRVGYLRFSTQKEASKQIESLKKYGVEKFCFGLKQALGSLKKGDALVVCNLNRLGYSVKQLMPFVLELQTKGVQFISLDENINTNDPDGQLFLKLIGELAAMEQSLIAEKTQDGLKKARQKGNRPGRKPLMGESVIEMAKARLASGKTVKEVAEELGVSIPTFYRWLPARQN